MSAMKVSGSGSTVLGRSSRARSERGALPTCASIPNGSGTWMIFVKIRGETHYLWRAVDHEGEVLESYVTKTRDTSAALKLLRKAMKRYGSPRTIFTDRLRSYGAAMKEIGNQDRQEVGRRLNNRAENSHLPFRRRERAMCRFRRMSQLQKLASTHASLLGSLQSRPPHQPETGLQNPARRRPSRMAPASRRLAGLTPHAAGDGFALD